MQQMNEWKSARANTYTNRVANSSQSHGGNVWTKTLETVAWVIFGVTIVGGIISAVLLADSAGGGVAFIVFLVSTASAFIVLAVVMVFLQMAKDVSSTAKDIAEIKIIFKSRRNE